MSQIPEQASLAEDQPFHHYSFRHRITAWISVNLCDQMTYTVRHGLLRGMKRKGGLGWVPEIFASGLHSREVDFLRALDLNGKVVYDVGAFHGLVTMFFATSAKNVISYEPNIHNRKRLEENLALNRLTNVTIRPFGLASKPHTAEMTYMPLMPGGASLESKTVEQLKQDPSTVSLQIDITTLDLDVVENNLPAPDFIKIDVEGFEYEALQGARETLEQYHPDLFLEMHGETMKEKRRKVSEIVGFLTDLGYSSIQHVETDTAITPANAEVAVEGHLFATWDV